MPRTKPILIKLKQQKENTEFVGKSGIIVQMAKPSQAKVSGITKEDKAIDMRVNSAIKAALTKADVCKKPIAYYDVKKKRAYIKYPNGMIEYVK